MITEERPLPRLVHRTGQSNIVTRTVSSPIKDPAHSQLDRTQLERLLADAEHAAQPADGDARPGRDAVEDPVVDAAEPATREQAVGLTD